MRIFTFIVALIAGAASAFANGRGHERPPQSMAALNCDDPPYTIASGEICRVICVPSTAIRARGLWTANIVDLRTKSCPPGELEKCEIVDKSEHQESRVVICLPPGLKVCVETWEGKLRHHNWFYGSQPVARQRIERQYVSSAVIVPRVPFVREDRRHRQRHMHRLGSRVSVRAPSECEPHKRAWHNREYCKRFK